MIQTIKVIFDGKGLVRFVKINMCYLRTSDLGGSHFHNDIMPRELNIRSSIYIGIN